MTLSNGTHKKPFSGGEESARVCLPEFLGARWYAVCGLRLFRIGLRLFRIGLRLFSI